MGDYLESLSEFAAVLHFDDLSEAAVRAANDVTLDTVGSIVAGMRLPENVAFARLASKRSRTATASILGTGLNAEPMFATLVNSTAGVALEVDEGNRFGGGHPAVHVLPGALAVAEETGASGRRLIEGLIVGYELASRIGGATRARPNVHSHGHWGAIGTATAVAKLKGYDASQFRAVINLAASMSPANTWTAAFRGATIRNLYPGRSGFHGILATHLYECGFTGLDDGPLDVYGTILGESFDPDLAIKRPGDEYRIQQNYFKFYACCRFSHPSLEAVLEARGKVRFAPEHVQKVVIQINAPILEGMFGEYPANMLAAKFNVPYAVAVGLVKGRGDILAFNPEAIQDERVSRLFNKVSVEVDAGLTNAGAAGLLAKAQIHLKDGRVLEGTSGPALWGDYGNRAPREALIEKFHSLNDEALGESRATEVIGVVERLDGVENIRALTERLRA